MTTVPTIGITGHTRLSYESAGLIMEALREALRDHGVIHGVTCLAEGADQLFAEAILDVGGTFEVVLPARDYRESIIPPDNRPAFDKLLARASSVSYMPFTGSDPIAFLAASEEVVRRSSWIIAVWDGVPAADVGGTAQVVDVARAAGLPVRVIWPEGAHRRVP